MRKETVIFGLIAIGLIAFFLGRLAGPEAGERPAAPPLSAVRPPVTAVAPLAEPAAKADGAVAKAGGGRAAIVAPAAGTRDQDATGSPAKGPTVGRVTMVVVSDFECPYCRRVGPTVTRLLREYRGDLRVVWKNNPLPFHRNAQPAAIAALAAHRQGKFWEYHDRLFSEGASLDGEALVAHAAELGLDVQKFRKDMDDPALRAQVEREQAAAKQLGAQGTPSFFINGKLLVGAKPYSEFKAYVDEARIDADREMRAGTPLAAVHETMARKNHENGQQFVDWFIRGEDPSGGAPTGGARPVAEVAPKPSTGRPAPPQPTKPEARRPSRPVPPDVWKVTIEDNDPMKGSADALVTIVLFSDFECPFCSKVNPTIEQILETFPGQVRVVWKNAPLPFHKNAQLAAEAALAAHAQGKFWEFHDLLFQNQRALARADLERYARQLELDMAKFGAALDGGTFKDEIRKDQALAEKVNARGTPNLFVNGRQVVGARPFEDFEPLIREELEKAKQIVAQGVSPQNAYTQIILRGKTFQALDEEVKSFSTSESPAKGKKDAPIVIAEFSDFQCPYCSRVGAPLKEVQKLFPDRVQLVFKHFPLTSIHSDAQLAAEASLAAHAQGKFWEYHDLLFQNQQALARDQLETYAEKVGLDMKKFRKALDEGTYRSAVSRDVADGQRAGVRGTPSVYINGRAFQPAGGMSVEALKKVIEDEFGDK